MNDEQQDGELDLADIIGSYLWDACDEQDEDFPAVITEEAMRRWENLVRDLLNWHRVNLFFDSSGNVRRQV